MIGPFVLLSNEAVGSSKIRTMHSTAMHAQCPFVFLSIRKGYCLAAHDRIQAFRELFNQLIQLQQAQCFDNFIVGVICTGKKQIIRIEHARNSVLWLATETCSRKLRSS